MWPFTGNVCKPARRHPTARQPDRQKTNTQNVWLHLRGEISYPQTSRYRMHFRNIVVALLLLLQYKYARRPSVGRPPPPPRWQKGNYAYSIIAYKLCRCRKFVVDFICPVWCAVSRSAATSRSLWYSQQLIITLRPSVRRTHVYFILLGGAFSLLRCLFLCVDCIRTFAVRPSQMVRSLLFRLPISIEPERKEEKKTHSRHFCKMNFRLFVTTVANFFPFFLLSFLFSHFSLCRKKILFWITMYRA